MDTIYDDRQLIEWTFTNMKGEQLPKILAEIDSRKQAAVGLALEKGDTEYPKGMVQAFSDVIEIFTTLINYADTKTETANS